MVLNGVRIPAVQLVAGAVLVAVFALLLDRAGFQTSLLTVANRELYEPALEPGQIDVVPEYAATDADWLNAKTHARRHWATSTTS